MTLATLEPLTVQTAPEAARNLLTAVREKYGFVPKLLGVLGHTPPVLASYMELAKQFSQTSLSTVEQHVVLLTASVRNRCRYCVAAHSVAAQMQQVSPAVIGAIRQEQAIGDRRLEGLRKFTIALIEQHGWLEPEQRQAFEAAGFQPEQVSEVMLGVAMKTLSNFINHLHDTPLDPAFADAAWTPPSSP